MLIHKALEEFFFRRRRYGSGPTPILKTAVGNPIHITDALARAVNELKVAFAPIQSGSGDPSPDNVRPITGWTGANVWRTGENLFNDTLAESYSSWSASEYGGSYGSDANNRTLTLPTVPNTEYTLTIKSADQSSPPTYISLCKSNEAKDTSSIVTRFTTDSWGKDSYTFTTDASGYYFIRIGGIPTQNAFNTQMGKISYFMFNLGSSASPYEAYVGTTYPLSWTDHGTVYGGTLDVVSGVLTSEIKSILLSSVTTTVQDAGSGYYRIRFVLSDCETGPWLARGIICNMMEHSNAVSVFGWDIASQKQNVFYIFGFASAEDANTWLTNYKSTCQFVYKLAEPQTIQLTPQELTLLAGENNLWSDTNGDLTLSYYADGNVSTIEALNTLLGGRYVNNHTEDEPSDEEALDIVLGR